MSDQGEPLSWRKTLQEQLMDVFQRHEANVTVGLTIYGVEIQSADDRVDVIEIEAPPSHPAPSADDSYGLVVMAKRSVNVKALPPFRVQEADLVIGKNNIVLKDRYSLGGQRLTDRELARILATARDVVTL